MVERSRSWLERMVKRVVAYSAIGFVDWEVEQVFYGWISKERNKRSGPRERGLIYLIWIYYRLPHAYSITTTTTPTIPPKRGKVNVSGLEFVFRNPTSLISDLSGAYPEN